MGKTGKRKIEADEGQTEDRDKPSLYVRRAPRGEHSGAWQVGFAEKLHGTAARADMELVCFPLPRADDFRRSPSHLSRSSLG